MNRRNYRRSGFTLVEMLVVIFIIAALASLLIVGIGRAISASQRTAMAMEISQLSQAVEAYKQDKGDYPPSLGESYSTGNRANTVAWRHITRAWPKMLAAKKTALFDAFNTDAPTPAEALVLFLSKTGPDLQDPFGATADFKVYFPFDERRLVARKPNNFTYYSYKPKYAKETFYYYYDGRKSNPQDNGNNPRAGYDLFDTANAGPKPYAKSGTNEFINATTFQIICAGLDGDFGKVTARKVIPFGSNGNTTTNIVDGDLDNITNFSDGKILKDLLDQ